MRTSMRVLLTLAVAAGVVAAGPIDEARERLRSGGAGDARAAVETLVAADSADAVKALQQGVEAVLSRLKKEQEDLLKKTKELVKYQDTVIEVASKVLEMISERKDGTPEYKALRKKQEQVREKNGKLKEDQAAAKAKVLGSEEILAAAMPAFARFRSDGAVEAIERVAAAKSGRLSRACTWALVRIGAARSQPALAGVSRATDTGQRAFAARGLRAAEGGVPAELAACLADKAWPVRYAAYDALAAGPATIPLLADAREKAPQDDHPRIDALLGNLTGAAPAEPPRWKEWWAANADAVKGGTFRRGADVPPEPPEDPAIAAVLSSRRLAFVLAADDFVERDEEAKKPNLFGPARDELRRVLAAVTDGSTFGIVVGGYVPPSTKAPARATGASRKAAADWLDKTDQPPRAPLWRMLDSLLLDEPDAIDYADTVLLVAASATSVDAAAADRLVAMIGEVQTAPVVHCVGIGDSFDEYLLACVALQTGGSFAGGDTRLHAKVPGPGADRWTAGTARVAAYRALKRHEGERDALTALARIGEEAFPLLPMIVDCLGSDRGDDVRAEALLVLGAMGPWARSALPRVEKLAGDGSQVVAEAARAALEKIAAK